MHPKIGTYDADRGIGLSDRLRQWFARKVVEWSITALVLVWTSLTVVELLLPTTCSWLPMVEYLTSIGQWLCALELGLRAVTERRRFVGRYLPDLIAVLPLIPQLAPARGFHALRFFRLLGLLWRRWQILPRPLLEEAGRCLAVLTLLVVLGGASLLAFERPVNPELRNPTQAFWYSVYSMVSRSPVPGPPMTVGGHVVTVGMMASGTASVLFFSGRALARTASRRGVREGSAARERGDSSTTMAQTGSTRVTIIQQTVIVGRLGSTSRHRRRTPRSRPLHQTRPRRRASDSGRNQA